MALSYDQQRIIDDLGQKAYTPSSNSNKARFELYAYIEKLSPTNTVLNQVLGGVVGVIVLGAAAAIAIALAKAAWDWAF